METSLTVFFGRILKLGATAYGGPGMLGQIKKACVNQYGWVTEGDFLRGLALCQIIPGATMVQIVTCIGYRLKGAWGALVATIGIFWPSFFILVLLIPYHELLRQIEKIRIIEQGILGSFVGMLASVLYHFGKVSFVDIPTVLFAAAAFLALRRKIGLPYILLSGGILSIFVFGYLL